MVWYVNEDKQKTIGTAKVTQINVVLRVVLRKSMQFNQLSFMARQLLNIADDRFCTR